MLISPPVPFTVTVSAEVMPVLPIVDAVASCCVLLSVPPIVMLLPPGPPMFAPSSCSVPLPVIETFPLTDWVFPGS